MNRIITNTKKIISVENFNNLQNYNNSRNWRKYLTFNHKQYHKTLVEEGHNYEMYLIGWLPWQKTDIHKHTNDCMFKVIYGKLYEDIFDNESKLIKTNVHLTSDTSIPNGIHSMKNNTFDTSVSLHIYEK